MSQIHIKKLLASVIVFAVLVSMASDRAMSDDLIGKRESLARSEIAKTPDSEMAHIQLAKILIEQKRYAEAKEEIALVRKLNPNNSTIPYMSRTIDIHESNLPPKEKLDAVMKSLSESMEALRFPVASSNKEDRDTEKAELDARYGISSYQFPAEKDIAASQIKKLIMELRIAGKVDQAMKISDEELEKNPNSAQARLDHAQMLLDLFKIDEAQEVAEKGLLIFPGHPMFRIILDGIKELGSFKSHELRMQLVSKIRIRLLKASLVRLDSTMKKHSR